MTETIRIESIRTDGGTQPRAALDSYVIEAYAESMEAGAKFPPIDVFYDGSEYWLADGFHRIKAAFGADFDQIECNVHQGTVQDAQWFSFAANKTNGFYRSNSDKQRAVQAALRHPKSQGMSDSAIAKHVGVDSQTVSNWRTKLVASSEVRKMDTRTVTRGGTTYQQNVSKIGRRSERTAEAPVSRSTVPSPILPRIENQPEPRKSLPKGFDDEDMQQLASVVASCRSILDNHLSARDLGLLISSGPIGSECVEILKETCEYLQAAIVAADAPNSVSAA